MAINILSCSLLKNVFLFIQIERYLLDIAERFPQTVTLVTPGESFEGRPLRYLKISTTNFEDTSKPIIFIDGGIHAREWISPPTVTWAIHKLTENVTEPELLENFDWILLPVVNPDGYQFTFTNVSHIFFFFILTKLFFLVSNQS